MPDAPLIPIHTMVHYPKEFLSEVAAHLLLTRGVLGKERQQQATDFFNNHLTTRAMARYLLSAAQFANGGDILFVDEAVGQKPDYQSVLTLIGLKQLLGSRVTLASPVPYIYSDWIGNSGGLYGRGFGYTRVLSPGLKSKPEASGDFFDLNERVPERVGAVVVGSITRNYQRAVDLLDKFPSAQTVWIHGEDEGPTVADLSKYREAGVTLFARELNVG